MKNTLIHPIWLAVALHLGFTLPAMGQNACFGIHFSVDNAQPGDTVEVAVTVRGFVEMVGYGFAVTWAPGDLQFIRHSQLGSPLTSQLSNPFGGPQGVFRTIWYDENTTGVTLNDGAMLFKLYFKVLATNPGFYPVKISPDNDPTIYNVTDAHGKSQPLAQVVGGVRVGTTSDLTLSTLCVTPPPCNGNLGQLLADVTGGIEPYQFQWTGPNGVESTSPQPGNLPPGDYSLTVTDAAGAVVQAGVRFFGGSSSLAFTTTTQNATCETPNGCASLSISGGTPPYTIQWDMPGSFLNRCDLSTGNHTVTVTDYKGCATERLFSIDKDTLLTLKLIPEHADCRFDQKGHIQLTHPGTAPFQYRWSNGATTAGLSNLSPGMYAVTVHDASGCTGKDSAQVKDYGTFDWSFSFANTCTPGANQGNIVLKGFALEQRTEPPLSLAWDNGTRQEMHELDESLVLQQMSSFTGVPSGTYTVTITDAEGCSQVEHISSTCLPKNALEPRAGEPQFFIDQYGYNGQIAVKGTGLMGIKTIRFSLAWDPGKMTFSDLWHYISNLQGVTPANFTVSPGAGIIDFTWNAPNPEGHGYDGLTYLFWVNFYDHQAERVNVDFQAHGHVPFIIEHVTEGPKIFVGRGGNSYFSPPTEYQRFPNFSVDAPSCAHGNYAGIRLQSTDYSIPDPYETIYGKLHPNGSSIKIPKSKLLFLQPGYFEFWAANGSFAVDVPPNIQESPPCVWPGDADNNQTVNHFDLLYLGLGSGSGNKFFPRTESDTLWQGAEAQSWSQETPRRHINYKYLDLDGNGIVEALDTTTLLNHWGKTVNPLDGRHPYALPAKPDTTLALTDLGIAADTVRTGASIKIPLTLSLDEGILGLAFSVSYDPAVMISEVRFEPSESWLGDPESNLMLVQKDFRGQNRLDIAISRTDQQAARGSGTIGYLVLTFKLVPPGLPHPTLLFISHALAITPQEKLIALGETRQEIFLRAPVVSATTSGWLSDEKMQLSPNPARNRIHLASAASPIYRVEINAVNTTLLKTFSWDAPGDQVDVDLGTLPAGIYFARIFCEKELFLRPFVVAQ